MASLVAGHALTTAVSKASCDHNLRPAARQGKDFSISTPPARSRSHFHGRTAVGYQHVCGNRWLGGSQKSSVGNRRRAGGVASAGLDLFVLPFEGVLADDSGAIFPGVKDALTATESPFYVVTGLDPVSVSSALQQGAGVDIPANSPRIVSQGGDKIAALNMVAERPIAQDPSTSLHFIDSDPSTLERVARDPSLQRWQLYSATWGQGVESQQNSSISRVLPASMEGFTELLRWGLLMGVNDGCQEYEDGRPAT